MKQERPYYCGPAALAAVQRALGVRPFLEQSDWAAIAGTTTRGTGPVGLKRALRLLGDVRVTRKRRAPFDLGIVFDRWHDHWVVVRCRAGVAILFDPWDGSTEIYPWGRFRRAYLSSSRESYALIVNARSTR